MTSPGTALTRRQDLEQLRGSMETTRATFIPHWRDLSDYILPRRARFTLSDTNRGDRRSTKIIDSTGTFAARTCASGMMTGITSPARTWFRLTIPNQEKAELASVKTWLHDVTLRIRNVFLRSNLYQVLPLIYYDAIVFGTAAIIVEEDDEKTIRCKSFAPGTYCIANDEHGRVRTFLHTMGLTTRQMVEKFDKASLSSAVRNAAARGEWTTIFEVVHFIMPNAQYDATRAQASSKAYSSCYYEKGANEHEFLRESGYDDFPVNVVRWFISGEDSYGTDSPGMMALGDIKQLQFGEKKSMQAIEKLVNPPLQAPSGMQHKRISLIAGDVSYTDEKDGVRPIHEIKPEIAALEGKQEQCRQRIRRACYEDLFLLNSYLAEGQGQPPTAAEIYERKEEKLLALGPVLEQLNGDLLDPLIDRTFLIMLRRGELPPAPPELAAEELKIEYQSVMHQAQKAAQLGQIQRVASYAMELATAAADPSVLDKLDIDQSIDEFADAAGVSPRVIRSDEDVAAIRAQRAESQQAAQRAETMKTEAEATRALSQADTSGENALTDLLAAAGR